MLIQYHIFQNLEQKGVLTMCKKITFGLLAICQLASVIKADPVILNADDKRNRRAAQKIIKTLNTCAEFTSETLIQNGDENDFADYRANFGKSLAFDSSTFHKDEYEKLVSAINSGNSADFEALGMGAAPDPQAFKLVNPQSLYSFDFNGSDGWKFAMPAAPSVTSAEAAGEMVEVYWHALLRDVPFNKYNETASGSGDPSTLQEKAIDGMNALSDFKGPKDAGCVTAQNLFRGPFAGETVGPYISQFLYLPFPVGAGVNFNGSGSTPPFDEPNYQTFVSPASGSSNDFMTDPAEWKSIQKGKAPSASTTFDESGRHFLRTARDLAEYVHTDYPGQAGINSALMLLQYGPAALDPNMYYLSSNTQGGFVTFGPAHIVSSVMAATQLALKAAWFQKWYVHRRLRPEVFGHLIDIHNTNPTGLHADILTASVFDEPQFASNKLLPMAYPEGSPCHPSYPAGHAAFAGAVVTILKAFFNEDFVIPNAIEPNSNNDALVAYTGPNLTVGGELNKLASNISIGRNMAGVHYRSDGTEGMILGEKVAIQYLKNLGKTYHEGFAGFTLTKFDGTTITVGAKS